MGSLLAEKLVYFLQKMLILNPSFQGETQFYAYFLFYILIILVKCLTFQILSRGISMYFSILTGLKMDVSIAEKFVTFC